MSPAGILAEDPKKGQRVPWSDVAFYLPQEGVLQTKDGSLYESDHLRSGGDNPWCLRAPRLPNRQLIRPWVDSEWIFTPDGEMTGLDRVRVLATSWIDLQYGKREWCRRHLDGDALHPFMSEDDREYLTRLPEPIHTEDPLVPDVPGSRIQGRVLLDVLVGEDGKPLCVVPLQPGSGRKSLQIAAIEAAYAWRFKPARKGRRAIPSWFPVPFNFRSG
jgi:TonB family protein